VAIVYNMSHGGCCQDGAFSRDWIDLENPINGID